MFSSEDESEFKRMFAVQFLAAMDAVNYANYRHQTHKPAVEDARFLAEKAWEEWKATIGLVEQSTSEDGEPQ